MNAIRTYDLRGLLDLLSWPPAPDMAPQLQVEANTPLDFMAVARIGDADRRLPPSAAPIRFSFDGVGIVLNGTSERMIGLSQFVLRPGMLFFVPAYQILNILSTSDDFDACMVVFSPEFYALRMPRHTTLEAFTFFQIGVVPYVQIPEADVQTIGSLMQALEHEYLRQAEHWKDVCHAHLRAVLLMSQRFYDVSSSDSTPPSHAGFWLAQRFQSMVESHFTRKAQGEILERKTMGDYACLLNVEEGYLTEMVKTILGKPPAQMVRERTVLEAKHLLHHTDWTGVEIADYLGFSDPAYFSRVFKQQAGVSPTEYRRTTTYWKRRA